MCLSVMFMPHRLTRDRPRRAVFLGVRVECGSDVAGSALCWPSGLHLLPSTPRSNCGSIGGTQLLAAPSPSGYST